MMESKLKDKTIVIDIDGVICPESKTFEKHLQVPFDNIKYKINRLHKNNTIILHTARGWAEFRSTQEWLNRHDIRYDVLLCGKPIADYVIDDRSFKSMNEFLNKVNIS